MSREHLPLKPTRHISPSFRLRGSAAVTFSSSGRFIGEIGRRAFIWDVASRKIISQFKVISHEAHLAINREDSLVAVKSTSGAIVFVELPTGSMVSATGKYKTCTEGANPHFLADAPLLLDGDWDGVLRLFDVMSGRQVSSYRLDGHYMITRLASCEVARRFVVVADAKHNQPGGSRLLMLTEPLSLESPSEIKPRNAQQEFDGGWRHIQRVALHPGGERVAVALDGRTVDDPNTIELIDLTGQDSTTITLPSRNHYVRGIAWSASGLLCVSLYENLHRPGQSLEEQIRNRSVEHCHMCFFGNETHEMVARWPWIYAADLAFAPGDAGLAISSQGESSAYIARKHLLASGLPVG